MSLMVYFVLPGLIQDKEEFTNEQKRKERKNRNILVHNGLLTKNSFQILVNACI